MSTETDRAAAEAPDGSFFNFASLNPAQSGTGSAEYYSDVTLECSPLFTEDNLSRIEDAVEGMAVAFRDAADSGVRVRIDGLMRWFQDRLGPDLLAELRKGIRYVNAVFANKTSTLRTVYCRDLAMRLFAPQVSRGLELCRHTRGWQHDALKVRQEYVTRRRMKWMCPSHYASYLSNVAAWMLRPTRPDMGTVHAFSLMLARAETCGDDARSMDRINRAMAVIAAELVRAPGFQCELSDHDGVPASGRVPAFSVALCVQPVSVISLRTPFAELQRERGSSPGVLPADLVHMFVDNLLVESPAVQESGEEDASDALVEPRLVGQSRYSAVAQRKTGLLPGTAVKLELDRASGAGIPMLAARTAGGFQAVLVPADGKCMGFLSKLYGVRLPDPLSPMPRNSRMLWAMAEDGEQFADLLRQMRMVPLMSGDAREYVTGALPAARVEHVGAKDLGAYVPGAGDVGMTVSELILY